MSGELVRSYGTQRTLEANGAAILNAGIGEANDAALDLPANDDNFPHVRFVISVDFAVAPTNLTTLQLVAQPLNVDGSSDCLAPSATYRPHTVGSFLLTNDVNPHPLVCDVYDAPPTASYWIYNSAGQTLPAGWTLKATPFAFKPLP
jgi:hypothetical protein